MKMLHSTAMMRLFILLIFVVRTAPEAPEVNSRAKRQVSPGMKIFMNGYPNSIDDDFTGCKEEMYDRVTKQLLNEELTSNANFRGAWNAAKNGLYLGNTWDSTLTRENLRNTALRAYTGNNIYSELDNKMREGRGTYMTEFGLISLHFLITDGIQARNAEQHPQNKCRTTFRRSGTLIEITDTLVRFGSFASSSHKTTLEHFGKKTCFIITTCYGAAIADISEYPEEAEVLIPPYEVFIKEPVTAIPPLFSKCERVYQLRSAGKINIMKCQLVNEL